MSHKTNAKQGSEQGSKKIHRRTLLAGAASTASIVAGVVAGGAAAGFVPAAPALAKGRRRLRQVTCWPKNLPGAGTAVEMTARRVEAMSDGELTIRVYAAGELVDAFEAFDAVSTGTADMYNGADYYWQGKDPAFAFFTTWPFGMTAWEFAGWIEFGGGQALWDEVTAPFNVRSITSMDTGTQSGGWFNRPINTPDDFKGLKMRQPGLGGEILRRMGGLPVVLPAGELYAAMQSGAIDAAEWIGPWNDMAIGFHQIAKYFYSPGFQESNGALSTGINLDVWHSLSKQHQTILEVACQAQTQYSNAEYFYQNARSMKILREKHNVTPRHFPEEVVLALRKTAYEVMEEIAAKNELAGRVYKSAQESLTLLRAWSPYAEEGFLKYRG